MFRGYRIVIVTPAGRERYLKLLFKEVYKLREYVDEYRLWVNTTNIDDIKYMEELKLQYPDFVTLEYLTVEFDYNKSIGSFFKNCIDNNTIYLRFDDDIIELDDKNAFVKFLNFRIDNPNYFLVFANILNNSIISNLHQRFGNFNLNDKLTEYSVVCKTGYFDSEFAENLHRQVLSKPLNEFRLPIKWVFYNYERVSINCISWFGSEFKKFHGIINHDDEEEWLTTIKPEELKMPCCMFGDYTCVHYAFCTQRAHLDNTDILARYTNRLT